jgi:hypothetical protein
MTKEKKRKGRRVKEEGRRERSEEGGRKTNLGGMGGRSSRKAEEEPKAPT